MRTKILLSVAAALAVGVATSMAQTTYSQNIVGYCNLAVPTNGFALIGHQFNLDGTNGISTIFGPGLVSDPNYVDNTEILLWNVGSQQYQTLYYLNQTDAQNDWGTDAGFYDGGGTFYNNSLPPGASVFLYNAHNTHSNLTVTFVGTVPQGTNVYAIQHGYNLFCLAAPVVTNLVSSLGNFSGTSDPNYVNNDLLLTWNPSTSQYQTLYYLNAQDANDDWGTGAGFYDGGGTLYSAAPNVGGGFFINHQVSGTEYWTNVFNFNN